MKQLADMIYGFGDYWIWFQVYGKDFCINHNPDDGVCAIKIDCDVMNDEVCLCTVMELAEYVRKYCPEASQNSHEILEMVKASVDDEIRKIDMEKLSGG